MKTIRYVYIFITCFMSLVLFGCGAAQTVTNITTGAAKAVFIWDVKTLHLDFTSRAELNVDDDFLSSPVVIRVYQLKNDELFSSAPYLTLVDEDVDTLGETLLEVKEFVLKPSSSISIDVPFHEDAEFVGIIALYKEPDLKHGDWRLQLKRRDLNIISARQIVVSKYKLELLAD